MERDLEKRLTIAVIEMGENRGDLSSLKKFVEEHGDKLTREELSGIAELGLKTTMFEAFASIDKEVESDINISLVNQFDRILEASEKGKTNSQ